MRRGVYSGNVNCVTLSVSYHLLNENKHVFSKIVIKLKYPEVDFMKVESETYKLIFRNHRFIHKHRNPTNTK